MEKVVPFFKTFITIFYFKFLISGRSCLNKMKFGRVWCKFKFVWMDLARLIRFKPPELWHGLTGHLLRSIPCHHHLNTACLRRTAASPWGTSLGPTPPFFLFQAPATALLSPFSLRPGSDATERCPSPPVPVAPSCLIPIAPPPPPTHPYPALPFPSTGGRPPSSDCVGLPLLSLLLVAAAFAHALSLLSTSSHGSPPPPSRCAAGAAQGCRRSPTGSSHTAKLHRLPTALRRQWAPVLSSLPDGLHVLPWCSSWGSITDSVIDEPLRAAPATVTVGPTCVTCVPRAPRGLNRPVGQASSAESVGRSRLSTVRSVFYFYFSILFTFQEININFKMHRKYNNTQKNMN
jgi:hypothetical protein